MDTEDKLLGIKITDNDLFEQPPPNEDCPICMLPMPLLACHSKYQRCCGERLCLGCITFVERNNKGKLLCPFCRADTEGSYDAKGVERRMKQNHARTFAAVGYDHLQGDGRYGVRQNLNKAMELLLRGAHLGSADALHNLAVVYDRGHGGEIPTDKKKAKHFYSLAAIKGNPMSRLALGHLEMEAGNNERASKHWSIAAQSGLNDGLRNMKSGYVDGIVKKEDYESALRVWFVVAEEMKSPARENAAHMRGMIFNEYPRRGED